MVAASPTQGAVSRGAGSPMTFPAGTSGNCSRTAAAWSCPVMTSTRSGGTSGAIRATVCWSIVASPKSLSNCFGRLRRLFGQNRVPLPPAMMTAWSMVHPERSDYEQSRKGFIDTGQCDPHDFVREVHPRITEVIQDRSSFGDDSASLGDQYEPNRSPARNPQG